MSWRSFLLGLFLAVPTLAQPTEAPADAFGEEQLESYYAGGVLAEARRAYLSGQYRKVKELLADDASRPGRYLFAMAHVRSGQHQAAAELLTALGADWQPLQDRLSFEAGRAFARARSSSEAERSFEAIEEDSLYFGRARFELSSLHARRRDLEAAVLALSPLLDSPARLLTPQERSRAFLVAADLERRRGRSAQAKELMLQAWALFPTSSAASTAARTYDTRKAPVKFRIQRAESLLAENRNKEALTLLSTVPTRKSEGLGCRVAFLRGMALQKERRHPEAARALAPALEQCADDDELRPIGLWTLAYSQRVVAPGQSPLTYLQLADEYPGHPLEDNAVMAAARQLASRGGTAEAVSLLDRIADEYAAGDQVADALFLRFWLLRLEGKPQEALAVLDELTRLPEGRYPGDPLRRAQYWRARTLEELGREGEAQSALVELADQSVASYYVFLARSRLDEVAPAADADEPAADPPAAAPLSTAGLREHRHFWAGVELLRLGERGAAVELFAVDRSALDEPSLRLLFHVLDASGKSAHAGVVARTYLRRGFSAPRDAVARRLYEAAFPLEYRPLISRHSRRVGVDPDLLQALVREESAFNPRARSTTGALGLTQLMPATAWQVGRALRWQAVTRRALLEPGRNLRLGSAYLASLQRQFDGNAVHAIASYNAGPGRVNRWLKDLTASETDEWVEQIPIDETREYVKKVLGSYAAYESLGADREN